MRQRTDEEYVRHHLKQGWLDKLARAERERIHRLLKEERGSFGTLAGIIASSHRGATGFDAAVLADSPVGYWKLDETSGTTAHDSSGNGLDGTINGSPTLNQSGPWGTAKSMLGTTNSYIDLGNPAALQNTSSCTLEYLVKMTAAFNAQNIFIKGSSNQAASYLFNLWAGRQPDLYLGNGSSSTESWDGHDYITSGDVTNWYLIDITISGTTVKFYVNGSQPYGNLTNSATRTDGGTNARIGHGAGTGENGRVWDCYLSRVSFYSTALSSTRVAAHQTARGS